MENLEIRQKFEEVYASEADSLFRYCITRVGDRSQAVDIVQDVFVALWQTYQKGEEVKNHQAYLFTILRNRIIDWYRKKKSFSLDAIMEKKEGESSFEPADQKAHEGIVFSAETRQVVEAINELVPRYREAVYLRLIEDLSPPEIASILGSSANIVSVRITRGIQKLKKKFNIEEL